MKKFYTLMIFACILSLITFEVIAQAPAPDWTKLYAGLSGKGASSRQMKVVNGFVYVAGHTSGGVFVIRYDSQNQSAPSLAMSYSGAEYAYDLDVDASGNIYVAARSKASAKGNTPPNFNFITLKFRPDGSLEWDRIYAGPRGVADVPQGLAVDTYGNVYVTGNVDGSGLVGSGASVTLKYNSAGDLLWLARMDDYEPGQISSINETAQDVAVDGNGDVYITGQSNGAMVVAKYAGNYTGPVGSYNPVVWKEINPGGGSGRTIGITNGNVIASGWGGIIASYTVEGVQNWVTQYASASFWNMALDGSAIYATGSLGNNMFTVKYDLEGLFQWGRTYNGNITTSGAFGRAIAVDACGNAYVTGRVAFQEGRNTVEKFPVIKYNSSRINEWEAYAGSGEGGGFDIATDPSGAVYVTGEYAGKMQMNCLTAKYPSGCMPPQTIDPFSTMEEKGLNSLNNYPNPFRSSTNISFRLAKAGNVSLNVFDLTGRRIQTLIQGQRNAGQHTVNFSGNNLPAGIYIYRLEANGYTKTGRMILER